MVAGGFVTLLDELVADSPAGFFAAAVPAVGLKFTGGNFAPGAGEFCADLAVVPSTKLFAGWLAAPWAVVGVPAAPVVGLVGSLATGFSGTDGSREASTSTAREGAVSLSDGVRSSFCVITRTSSNFPRLAAGFTRISRKVSLPWDALLTVPTGNPLGKIRSPPLVTTASPGCTASSLVTFSR